MKIQYQDLITEANRRKDALIDLENILAVVPQMTLLAHDLQAFARRYKTVMANLDRESLALLPIALKKSMDNALVHTMNNIYDERYNPPGNDSPYTRGLLQLNDYLAGAE